MAWDSIRARIDKYRPRAAAPWRSTMTEPATSPTAIPAVMAAGEYALSDLDTRDLYWPEQMMTRCDADSSERYAVKWDSLHGTLKLCSHHSRAFATKLHAQGWHVTSPSL